VTGRTPPEQLNTAPTHKRSGPPPLASRLKSKGDDPVNQTNYPENNPPEPVGAMVARADVAHDDHCESFPDFDASIDVDCQCAGREVEWVAREALALTAEHIPAGSPRRQAYMDRKRALLAYIEARNDGAR
jgi:hypothetical protein